MDATCLYMYNVYVCIFMPINALCIIIINALKNIVQKTLSNNNMNNI